MGAPSETVNPTVQNSAWRNLKPFYKGDPRLPAIARKGGSVCSPEKRIKSMLTHYCRKDALAYAQYADISPKAALELMKVFLDEGRYRNFLAREMFELLGATEGYFEESMTISVCKDSDGRVHVNHQSAERKEAIRLKMKSVELLLKAGRAFFPEMRETGPVQAVQVNITEQGVCKTVKMDKSVEDPNQNNANE